MYIAHEYACFSRSRTLRVTIGLMKYEVRIVFVTGANRHKISYIHISCNIAQCTLCTHVIVKYYCNIIYI